MRPLSDRVERPVRCTESIGVGDELVIVGLFADHAGRQRRRGPVNAADEPVLAETARHILRPDEDLSGFYEAAHDDPDLAWAPDGSGRMLRSRRSSRTSSTQMIRGELLISRERTARRSSLTLDAFPTKDAEHETAPECRQTTAATVR
jgi:hypothetical protein